MNALTKRELTNITYRLKHRQFTPKMVQILKALDESLENYPSAVTCQQIANLAGVNQSYVQRMIRCLEAAGYVKLWKRRDGTLCVPGVFVLKGWKSLEGAGT